MKKLGTQFGFNYGFVKMAKKNLVLKIRPGLG
jgi:hypothetical protein